MKISEIKIGADIFDVSTKTIEKVLDKTENSILISQKRQTKFGINCDQWFTEANFNRNFKIV